MSSSRSQRRMYCGRKKASRAESKCIVSTADIVWAVMSKLAEREEWNLEMELWVHWRGNARAYEHSSVQLCPPR